MPRHGRAPRQTRSAIGTDACICADAFVGPGVTVDEDAILETGAIVLKDVKPWMTVNENTARD
jgi:putative colanic acid biosynthesis acetyltransferase WcaF